jgi:AAA15 family ATPase/GTPase
MGKQHQFTSFSLFRAPGFPSHTFPDLRSLHGGLNVVHGPNGVGKTTMVRTMRGCCSHRIVRKTWKLSPCDVGRADVASEPFTGQLVQKRLDTGEEIRLPGRNDEYADAYWFRCTSFWNL